MWKILGASFLAFLSSVLFSIIWIVKKSYKEGEESVETGQLKQSNKDNQDELSREQEMAKVNLERPTNTDDLIEQIKDGKGL